MHDVSSHTNRSDLMIAGLVGIVTGLVSGLTVNPIGELSEQAVWWPPELLGFLSVFSLSAGLAFGVVGAAFLMIRRHLRGMVGLVWLLTSMGGMAAAVYVAMLVMDYDANVPSYVLPYLLASPVGALIMAIPIAVLARMAQPTKVIAAAAGLPTIWAVAVALAMAVVGTEEALEVPWLLALFTGWQALFLMAITRSQT